VKSTKLVPDFFITQHYETICSSLFYSGEYTKHTEINKGDSYNSFYSFEILFNTNRINIANFEEYIRSLYKKQYVEIMQTNYIMSKLGHVDKKLLTS
jgi:hypothetical protein